MKNNITYILLLLAFASCKKADTVSPVPIPVVPTPILSSAKELSSFSFTKAANTALSADVVAVIDAVNHTILATVPAGTGVTGLKASFTISADASLKVGAAIQASATTANDFTAPLIFTVTAQNGTTQNYSVTVKIEAATTTTSNLVIRREEFASGPPVQTIPIQTMDYTYNATNQLTGFKDIGGTYTFDYDANGLLRTQTVKDNAGNVINTFTYTLNSNKLPLVISGSYGQTVETYTYGIGGQLTKYTKSYYGAVKDTYEYTSDGKNRIKTAKYISANDPSGVYTVSNYEYYDDVFDPNPLVKVAITPGVFGGLDASTGKVYALKTFTYQKYNADGPIGTSLNEAYTYTINAGGYSINTLQGADVRVKYTFK